LDYYGAKFSFSGCGFAISYGVTVGGSGTVLVYVDGTQVDSFDVSSATERYQNRSYQLEDCSVHNAAFGTETIRSMWLVGVEVFGDYAPVD
jgi:hypothetical protein